MNAPIIPVGYWANTQGNLVHENNVKPIDKLRDQTVRDLYAKAEALHKAMHDFKVVAFGDVNSFVEVSVGQYGAKVGGNKGNLSLTTFDGSLKIVVQIQESLQFGEQLVAAKALIDECVAEWTEGSPAEIKTLINAAFQTNKAGEISTSKILGLKRLDIQHDKWQMAMQAISDSINIASSKPYIRFYFRDDNGQYIALPLDMAAITF